MDLADTFTKDSDEVLDYLRNWAADLAVLGDDDTIATSTWAVVEAGITIDSESHTDTTATVWLSGGTLDGVYHVRNRITTVGGRTLDKTLTFKIKSK